MINKRSHSLLMRAVIACMFCLTLCIGTLCGCSNVPDSGDSATAVALAQSDRSQSSASAAPAYEPSANTQAKANSDSESSVSNKSKNKSSQKDSSQKNTKKVTVKESGTYTSKEEVALYIHTYNKLPSNYISKTKAKKAGWVSSEGNLDIVCPGKSIGGGPFYNDDELLPDAPGRAWKECDINYTGGFRGSERIVYSNDGLIFYTADHYKTFEQLY